VANASRETHPRTRPPRPYRRDKRRGLTEPFGYACFPLAALTRFQQEPDLHYPCEPMLGKSLKDRQILLSQRVNVALRGSVATDQVGALR
jgi:hypothetical protein